MIYSLADYEALRPHLFPAPDEMPARWAKWERIAKEEVVTWFTLDGFFWFPRVLLGIEPHLFAFYDQPELLHRINSDLADWHLKIIERLGQIYAPDFMTFAEDLSYNNGPMLSQAQFEEFLTPYYRRVIPALRKLGVIPLVDSDGDIFHPAGVVCGCRHRRHPAARTPSRRGHRQAPRHVPENEIHRPLRQDGDEPW